MNRLADVPEMSWFEMLDWAGTVALDAIVAFVSQRDEMGVNQGLEQDDEGKQNSLYTSEIVCTDYFLLGLICIHFMNLGYSSR